MKTLLSVIAILAISVGLFYGLTYTVITNLLYNDFLDYTIALSLITISISPIIIGAMAYKSDTSVKIEFKH